MQYIGRKESYFNATGSLLSKGFLPRIMVFNLKDSFFNVNNPCSYVKLKLSEVIFIVQNQVTSGILNFIPANVSLVKSKPPSNVLPVVSEDRNLIYFYL